MQITNDQIEDMVAGLHRNNAEQVTYSFTIEKEGERFTLEISLKQKEEDCDE